MRNIATIGSLFVNLNANTSNFEGGMNRARSSASGLSSVMGGVGRAIAGFMIYDVGKKLVSGFVDATKAGIAYNAMLETSLISWKALMGGSQKEANATVKMLEKLAAVTPFDFEGVDKFAKKLTIAGLGGKDLEKNIISVGDAVSVMGGGTEELNGVATALSQMSMKGKVSAEEMQQLAERNIPAYKLLAEGMGVTTSELMKMMQSGDVMSKEALPILIAQMDKAFGGAMKNNVGSFNGDMSTLKDTFKTTMGVLSKPMFEMLKSGISGAIPILNNIKDAVGGEGGLMGAIKKFAPALLPFVTTVIEVFNKLKSSVQPIIQSLSSFWQEHGALISGIVLFAWNLIGAIIMNTIDAIVGVVQGGLGLIDGIINLFQNLFKGNFKGAWDSVKQIFSQGIKFAWNLMMVNFAVGLPGMIKNFGKSAVGLFKGMWSSIKGFFSGGISGCLGFVRNLLSSAKSNFNTLKTFGANTFNALWQTAKNAMSGLYNAVRSNISRVPSTIRSFMTSAVNVIRRINLFSIGSSMIKGLINGIKNAGANVAGAIGNVVNGAVEAAKKKLKINSPSKVFMAIGGSVGEGLVKGINNEGTSVAKASSNLAGSTMGGYNAKLKGFKASFNGSNSSNNKNVNITVQNMNVADKGSQSRTLSQLNFLATV